MLKNPYTVYIVKYLQHYLSKLVKVGCLACMSFTLYTPVK